MVGQEGQKGDAGTPGAQGEQGIQGEAGEKGDAVSFSSTNIFVRVSEIFPIYFRGRSKHVNMSPFYNLPRSVFFQTIEKQ